ncbi:MAG: hypothetical protein SCI25_00255 [Desulfuromonadales bacterium]|nr:hypothetical protein [Desulfuromonadales bacterium]
MKNTAIKTFGWPNLLVILLSGMIGAWLALDPEQAARLFGHVGPILGAGVVIAFFALLTAAVVVFIASLCRR